MGLATFAKGAFNEVEKVENPRFLKKDLKKLQYLSRDLSRKTKKSRNWYKVRHAGKGFLQADKFYPSTKNCHNCGQRHELSLKDRILECSCGNKIDRDVNAAMFKGRRDYGCKACGAGAMKQESLAFRRE
ncbi:MAG: zinc ribbon domain-containing protein [Rhabdochlamydiaceae bacterium]|nr:zinc ribbon domain-containing protein [Candidatus Amphrikana amoebophyrae]